MGLALLLVGFACTGIINEFSYSINAKSKEAQHWKTTKQNSIRLSPLAHVPLVSLGEIRLVLLVFWLVDNVNQSWLACTFFPALLVSYMYLLRILIGSLDYLCVLWLGRVITLFLRYSVLKTGLTQSSSVVNKMRLTFDTKLKATLFKMLWFEN